MRKPPHGNKEVLPDWVHLCVACPLPEPWMALAATFAKLTGAVLYKDRTRSAIISVSNEGDRIGIRFHIAPRPDVFISAALHDVAERLVQLSRSCVPLVQESKFADQHPPFMLEGVEADTASVDLGFDAPPSVVVFKWDSETLEKGLFGDKEDETSVRIKRSLTRLHASGSCRKLAWPVSDWSQKLDELETCFPNFAEVIRSVIRPHVALIAMGYCHRMPPILLVGPPGVGKTHFARSIHHVLGTPTPLLISMAGETNGAALNGSSTFWSNSRPGQLYDRLAFGVAGEVAIANPLIVIDEVDKAVSRDHDPLAGLYGLLEAETAACFQDQALPDVTIDASRVRFLLTANATYTIPEPLLSRMVTFEIDPPTAAQTDAILGSVFEKIINALGIQFDTVLPDQLREDARLLSPRAMRTQLEAALAHAAMSGRGRVELTDWRAVRARSATGSKRGIGFVL